MSDNMSNKEEFCHKCGHDAFHMVQDVIKEHDRPSEESIRRFNEIGRITKFGIGILVTLTVTGVGANWKINKNLNDSSISQLEIIIASEIKLLEKDISKNADDIDKLQAEVQRLINLK